MKLQKRIIFATIIGVLAILMLLLFENFTKSYFLKNNKVLNAFHHLETQEVLLDYEILESTFFLYKNFDSITNTQKDIEKALEYIQNTPIKKEHKDVYKKFLDYKKQYTIKLRL